MRARLAAWALPGLVVSVALACGASGVDIGPPPPGAGDGGGTGASSGSNGASSGSSGASSGSSGGTSSSGDGGGSSSGADAAADAGGKPFVFRDINHVLGTGQSLSVGSAGTPPLSTTQPFANLMFETGPIAGGTNLTSFVPLVEGLAKGVPSNVETHSSAFANLISQLAHDEVFAGAPVAMRSHDLLVSGHGIGGTAYSGLKKGTTAFSDGMEQVKAAKSIAAALKKSYVVRAVTNVHGESDHLANNTNYANDLVTWQSDYDTDVRALTGQTDPIPMLHTQMSSWTKLGSTTSLIPILQLGASVSHPDAIVLVGPKYHLPYAADGVHLTNTGYQHMGEDYAKVYRRVVLEGRRWEPLRAISVTRAGSRITVRFAVPVPPLVLDDEAVTDPGNYGFEYAETGGTGVTITDVNLTGPDTVTIDLSDTPTGQDKRLRYAFTGILNAPGGPTTGPRGNLRDSDATVSRIGEPLYNWCVHFDEAVP